MRIIKSYFVSNSIALLIGQRDCCSQGPWPGKHRRHSEIEQRLWDALW